MPKGTPRRGSAWVQNGKTYSSSYKTGKIREGDNAARAVIGDENMAILKRPSKAVGHDPDLFSEPVYSDEAEYTRKMDKANDDLNRLRKREAMVKKGKERSLAAGKARIKDDFSEAVEMVKKKKTTNRNAY